jgi:hypothetical protein
MVGPHPKAPSLKVEWRVRDPIPPSICPLDSVCCRGAKATLNFIELEHNRVLVILAINHGASQQKLQMPIYFHSLQALGDSRPSVTSVLDP